MTMTVETTDWDKVQSVIDSIRNRSDENDPQQALINRVKSHISQFEQLVDDGLPYQEIVFTDSNEPIGIPIDLAYMILGIFEFCAYSNIDIASAMEQIKNV
jgi:hypothetical protein